MKLSITIYLFKNDYFNILGFHINDFDTGGVIVDDDNRDVCVSSVVAFRLFGTEIDRFGNSFELFSIVDDDDGARIFFVMDGCKSMLSLTDSVVVCSIRGRILSRVF